MSSPTLTMSREQQLELLYQTGLALSAEKKLEAIVQIATDAGRAISGAAFGAFFYNVLDEQGESYQLYTLSGVPRAAFEHYPMPRNTAVFAPTFSGEAIVRSDDITSDPRYGKNPPHFGMPKGHIPVRSYLAVPVLASSGEVLGGLFFGHPRPAVFDHEHEKLIGSIAAQAATAIENSRLHDQLTRKIKEAQQQSARVREMLESTTDSVFMLDREWRFTYLNQRAVWMIAEGRDLLGHDIWEAFPQAVDSPFWISYQRTMNSRVPTEFMDYYAPLRKWFEVHAYPTESGIVVFFHDVTEKRRTERTLAASEERYRSLVRATAAIVWTTPASGEFDSSQPEWSAFTGQSYEELRGWGWLDAVHPHDREHTRNAWLRSIETGSLCSLEHRLRRVDGEYRHMTVRVVPILDNEGKLREFVGVHTDVTDRIRAEVELRRTTQRLQLALTASNAGTWVWNPMTDSVDLDTRAAEIFGYRRGGPITWHEMSESMLLPEFREPTQKLVMEAIAQRETYRAEYEVRWPDGREVWVLAVGQPVFSSMNPDHVVSMIGTVQDITARKAQEEALRRTEKLAAAGRMAASVAHEINNPLEAATNLLFLAATDPALGAETRDYLRQIDSELRRVAHVARQTLGFYRESQSPAMFDVQSRIRTVLRVFASKVSARSIELLDQSCPVKVYGVPGEFEQVITNLVANAIDATGSCGKLILRTKPARLRNGAAAVQVTVADTGQGISTADHVRIFDAFYTTKPAVGTGLGLWVTRDLVEKNRGTLRFKSRTTSPSGTVFSIFLPASAK